MFLLFGGWKGQRGRTGSYCTTTTRSHVEHPHHIGLFLQDSKWIGRIHVDDSRRLLSYAQMFKPYNEILT